jgi:ribosomal protein S18 acetylase RimI-like enzyme
LGINPKKLNISNSMADNIQITEASNKDIKSLVHCWSQIDGLGESRPFGGDIESEKTKRAEEMILHAINTKNSCILKACSANEIIGTIAGHIFERPTVRLSPIGVVYSLWVESEFRNQGIGQKLLNRLEQFLIMRGAKSFQVGWDTPNLHAGDWWQKRGYAPYEIIANKPVPDNS